MKYVTFLSLTGSPAPRWGVVLGETVVDLQAAQDWARGTRGLQAEWLPDSLLGLIQGGPSVWAYARALIDALAGEDPLGLRGAGQQAVGLPLAQVRLLPPLSHPPSVRDFYAFEQHVRTVNANRGSEVPPEWYEFPVFYFTNPHAIFGPDDEIPHPQATRALDYELEIACVIGLAGKDIPPDQAEEHIFGYMILNDWSARDVQRKEMRVGLGPAKGKDFATSLGPWLVTPDELSDRKTPRPGVYDLEMVARVNGVERSRGNFKEIHYSFGDLIARASADTVLQPGDLLGSGTVGTGCLLELTRGEGPWLQAGAIVELEIERLGVLRNQVAGTTPQDQIPHVG
ncbi:MAG: fumarylacetoacetate hydrolase family protein [Candidatus Tectomicrobia bacterium]|uniref:Fumarylacetoacetate hydrolase family protein n=1 Tax=Tectimicrobiota bacterium TaxID=2528274 RepID=A0A932CNV5_UNCTE|nr:fumarylacetoacetate hydrolase family protein [Candidatus Tectomicrobia bacterium]